MFFYNRSIIISMMANNVEDNQGKGLRGTARWAWEALRQAKTGDQFRAVLAQVIEKAGDGDVTLTLTFPGPSYVKIMGNAWLAKQYGEIEEISPTAYADRAFQVMDLNLKNIAVKRRH